MYTKREEAVVKRPDKTPPPPHKNKNTGDGEIGGRPGLEPTRYGDWEKKGRCIDF